MHIALLFLAAIGSVHGQIQLTELTTNGDGTEAYFRSVLSLKTEAAEPAVVPGRIFRVGPGGFELDLERTRAYPPPDANGFVLGLTNYFDLLRRNESRDGRVVAVVGRRECTGRFCGTANYFHTTVTGLPGGTFEVDGEGALSGNGRYLLVFQNGLPRRCWFVVDLENPGGSPCTVPASGYGRTAGRAIADDGTGIVSDGALEFIQGTQTWRILRSGSPKEAVIDAAAKVVVYSVGELGGRSIRAYRIAEQQDYELASWRGADSHAPMLSADGSRVLFLSTVFRNASDSRCRHGRRRAATAVDERSVRRADGRDVG